MSQARVLNASLQSENVMGMQIGLEGYTKINSNSIIYKIGFSGASQFSTRRLLLWYTIL